MTDPYRSHRNYKSNCSLFFSLLLQQTDKDLINIQIRCTGCLILNMCSHRLRYNTRVTRVNFKTINAGSDEATMSSHASTDRVSEPKMQKRNSFPPDRNLFIFNKTHNQPAAKSFFCPQNLSIYVWCTSNTD